MIILIIIPRKKFKGQSLVNLFFNDIKISGKTGYPFSLFRQFFIILYPGYNDFIILNQRV